MLKEISLFGVYISPIFPHLLLAALLWLALRWLLTRARVYRHIWHPPLFNTALYIILLAAIYHTLNLDPRPAPISTFLNHIYDLLA